MEHGGAPEGPTDDRSYSDLLFERHPEPLFAMDGTGRFMTCNAAFEAFFGYRADELRAFEHAPFVDPDDAARVSDEFLRAARGERREFEARGVRRGGGSFRVHVTYLPVEIDGEVVRVFAAVRDVSERAAARAALEASEHRFRGLFEGAGSGIAILTLDARFVEANPAFLAMLGYSLEELRERDFLDVTHPDDQHIDPLAPAALAAGQVPTARSERRYVAKHGAVVWARTSVSLIRNADGSPLHVAVTAEDVTVSRLAEERLQRSESLRRLAGALALVGGWSVEVSDRAVTWSEEIYRILDVPGGQAPALEAIVERYAPAHRQRLEAALEACLAVGAPFDLELEIETFAGRWISVRAIGEAQRGADGEVVRAIGAFQDTSDLRAATRRAEESAQRLTTSLESMTDAFFTLDRGWRFTFLNERAAQLLHRPREALRDRVIWEEFPDAVDTAVYEAYERAMSGQGTQVVDDYYFPPLETWFAITAYPSPQGLAVYFRDVTEHRAAVEATHAHETVLRRQAHLLDEAQDAILVRDVDQRITYWNRGAQRIYGWSVEEALGADARELLLTDSAAFEAATAEVAERGTWAGDLVQRTRTGEQVVVAARWTLVRDADGRPEAILSINTDITERQRIEQQLLRAQRMESIGTLAGGVAHDLNNVLSPILLAAELLQLHTDDADSVELLATIASSARRGADLVTQVLTFARGVEGKRVPVDIGALLTDIGAIVRDTFPKNLAFEIRTPERLRGVVGDSTQIQQVLLNLVVNARDAMPDGGALAIRSSEMRLDAQYASATPGTTPGDYLLVEVEDSGVGMTAEVRDRVFEPFFTTKPQGAGTGLGLSTSAAIVQSHGGFLRVYSEPGRGSRFRMYLPLVADDGAAVATAVAITDLPRGNGETVLVVDDEAAVRAMTLQTLEAYGYQTLEAGNGAEAVAVFAQHRGEIAVVLTDMMMPIMDGPTSIHALRKIDPELRIIGASGLHGNGKVARAASAGVRHFLPKPYTSRSLLQMLAEVLAER